jgi:hypothetical protein
MAGYWLEPKTKKIIVCTIIRASSRPTIERESLIYVSFLAGQWFVLNRNDYNIFFKILIICVDIRINIVVYESCFMAKGFN